MNAFYRDFTFFTSPEILNSVRNVENLNFQPKFIVVLWELKPGMAWG